MLLSIISHPPANVGYIHEAESYAADAERGSRATHVHAVDLSPDERGAGDLVAGCVLGLHLESVGTRGAHSPVVKGAVPCDRPFSRIHRPCIQGLNYLATGGYYRNGHML